MEFGPGLDHGSLITWAPGCLVFPAKRPSSDGSFGAGIGKRQVEGCSKAALGFICGRLRVVVTYPKSPIWLK